MASSPKIPVTATRIVSAAVLALVLFPPCCQAQKQKEKQVVTAAAAEQKLPRLVIILRHAEKSGDERDPDLTPTGFQRAKLLPQLFARTPNRPVPLARPDALFATTPSKKSNRPAQTIAPLGLALNERIDLDFGKDDEGALAREVLDGHYAGKVVLIVWHHGKIPALAQAFGVDAPPKWKDEVFDQIWEITYDHGAAQLATAPEQLLPGDSTK